MRLTPNTENSGIQFRSERLENGEVKGYQADAGAGWWGKLYEEHGRGLLWKKPGDFHVKKEGWNTYEIVAVGDRILTAINGELERMITACPEQYLWLHDRYKKAPPADLPAQEPVLQA